MIERYLLFFSTYAWLIPMLFVIAIGCIFYGYYKTMTGQHVQEVRRGVYTNDDQVSISPVAQRASRVKASSPSVKPENTSRQSRESEPDTDDDTQSRAVRLHAKSSGVPRYSHHQRNVRLNPAQNIRQNAETQRYRQSPYEPVVRATTPKGRKVRIF